MRLRIAAVGLALALSPPAQADQGTEIQVLSAAAVQIPVEQVAQAFAADTGHRVRFVFATAGQVHSRATSDARAAIIITTSERAPALEPDVNRHRPLGAVRIGLAVRPGAPRPDVSSVDALVTALRRARTIAYGDPARGATTGIHFASVIERLGLTADLASKSILAENGLDVMRRVVAGEADLGITQISEILHVDAATLVGPLPEAVQLRTTYVAIIRPDAPASARQLVDRWTDAGGRLAFRAAGFE